MTLRPAPAARSRLAAATRSVPGQLVVRDLSRKVRRVQAVAERAEPFGDDCGARRARMLNLPARPVPAEQAGGPTRRGRPLVRTRRPPSSAVHARITSMMRSVVHVYSPAREDWIEAWCDE